MNMRGVGGTWVVFKGHNLISALDVRARGIVLEAKDFIVISMLLLRLFRLRIS